MPKGKIQDYKERFAKLYTELLNDYGVETASVAVTWTVEYKNGVRSIKPITTITF